MATAGIKITAEIAELRELQAAIGKILTPDQKAVILKDVLEKALNPALLRLRETTPLGPTGNLRRAITSKVKMYPKSGNAVAVIGYRQSGKAKSRSAAGGSIETGPDRAFHQWWLENGTKQRLVSKPANKEYTRSAHTRRMKSGKVAEISQHKVARQGGYIASSFAELGEFDFVPTARPPRGQSGHRVQTNPAYQRAFFKKSSNPIVIPPMPVGGSSGRPPLQTAWNDSEGKVASILQQELRIALEKVIEALTYTRTGTAT